MGKKKETKEDTKRNMTRLRERLGTFRNVFAKRVQLQLASLSSESNVLYTAVHY
jgi:hypothetical protein